MIGGPHRAMEGSNSTKRVYNCKLQYSPPPHTTKSNRAQLRNST